MAARITSDCIACGACEPLCPNHAILPGNEGFVIDPARCTHCVGFYPTERCQAICPVECCVPDPMRLETEQQLLQKALLIHPENDALQLRALSNAFPSRFRKREH